MQDLKHCDRLEDKKKKTYRNKIALSVAGALLDLKDTVKPHDKKYKNKKLTV